MENKIDKWRLHYLFNGFSFGNKCQDCYFYSGERCGNSNKAFVNENYPVLENNMPACRYFLPAGDATTCSNCKWSKSCLKNSEAYLRYCSEYKKGEL